jgi:26S proteasome regulatory subunit N5
MTKVQKADYILEQVRLTLLKKDFVRAHIVAKKINKKWLVAAGFGPIKIKFYTLMLEYYVKEGEMMELFTCYNSMYNTPQVQADPAQWQYYLPYAVLFVLLSPYGPTQNNMLHTLAADPKLKELDGGAWHALVTHFVTPELAEWPLKQLDMVFAHPVFAGKPPAAAAAASEEQKQVVADAMKGAVEDTDADMTEADEDAKKDDKADDKKKEEEEKKKKEEEEEKNSAQQALDTPDFTLAPYTIPAYVHGD